MANLSVEADRPHIHIRDALLSLMEEITRHLQVDLVFPDPDEPPRQDTYFFPLLPVRDPAPPSEEWTSSHRTQGAILLILIIFQDLDDLGGPFVFFGRHR